MAALRAADGPMSPQQVLEAARFWVPGLSIATVYRNLARLRDVGALQVVHLPGLSARYEATRTGHHHHFVCDDCGRVVEIKACVDEVDRLIPTGFAAKSHEITLRGTCPRCLPQ